MITIKVADKFLYIPKNTVLVLEQNSNIEEDGITADIVWTFSLPAEINQRILGAVQYAYVGSRRRYDCEIAVDGVPISRGQLYVQTIKNEKRLECGIVANAFGIGFGDKMLREDDYGEDIVIAREESKHKDGWREFLLKSLDAESVYKFFLFADSKFYKNNEDYGYFKGKPSPLAESDSDKLYTGYVNRLFYYNTVRWNSTTERMEITGTVLHEAADDEKRGTRLFNTASTQRQNGYCFVPALRLDWLVRRVLANAGLAAFGTFFTDENIKRLFVQSMCAMDGSSTQYGAKNSTYRSSCRIKSS